MDAALSQPCQPINEPQAPSYDAWQDWVQSELLQAYGTCAARHAATVKAWPKQ